MKLDKVSRRAKFQMIRNWFNLDQLTRHQQIDGPQPEHGEPRRIQIAESTGPYQNP